MKDLAWDGLHREIAACVRCPRLRAHCLEVARVRRRAYREQAYWGLPVPGFGDRRPRLAILGLAPAAHGANRTGRMFTGDSSGAWLYGALHRAGIANRPDSVSRDDGLALRGAFVTAACRCAPPGNRPSPAELAACASFLDRELDLLGEPRVILALGRIAWDTAIRRARRADPAAVPRPAPAFGHGAEVSLTLRSGGPPALLLGCYHPSRQNTQTGRLTRAMFESMILRTARAAGLAPAASRRSRKGGRTKTRMKSRGAWEDA